MPDKTIPSTNPTSPLTMGTSQQAEDNIPLLTEMVNEQQSDISSEGQATTDAHHKDTDDKKTLQLSDPQLRDRQLRDRFEAEMNKRIRRTLQETERRLQKEMQSQLDNLFQELK